MQKAYPRVAPFAPESLALFAPVRVAPIGPEYSLMSTPASGSLPKIQSPELQSPEIQRLF